MKKISIVAVFAAFLTVAAVMAASAYFNDVRKADAETEEGAGYKKTEEMQIIISMGESPGKVFISWKGTEEGPGFIRISRERETLPAETARKAVVKKVLNGRYCRYTARIDGLDPGEIYYYEIGDGVLYGKTLSFTAPDGRKGRFLYLGDVQFNVPEEYEKWGDMTEAVYERNPDLQFAIIGGDMVNMPLEYDQWNGFLSNCGVFRTLPLMTVSGNHEGVRSNMTYKKMFAVPENGPEGNELEGEFYYFDYGECRFIMTDSSFLTKKREEQIGSSLWEVYERKIEKWLRATLASSPKAWNIVVTHHPPYGMHDNDEVSHRIRELWTPIMEEYGTDLVLCGHQHMYMRTKAINGITYVMGNSGERKSEYFNGMNAPVYCAAFYSGASYQIIEADKRKMRITSYDKNGDIIDDAVLRKGLWPHIFEFFGGYQVIIESAEMYKVV